MIIREFKQRGWDKKHPQTPMIEGRNLNTVLFGISKVTPLPDGVTIKDVLNDEEEVLVVLEAGLLQNLSSGIYDVFETTALEDSVKQGINSKDWLGSIEVIEANIETGHALGKVWNRMEGTVIAPGCLAYLTNPGSIKTNVRIDVAEASEHGRELLKQLKGTNMLNVSRQCTQDPDLTTITKEKIKDKMCWVARRRGDIIVPPIGLGREEVMASNLSRHSRYHMALARAKSPKKRKEVLENVSLKVFKIEKVQSYRTKGERNARIEEALEGIDISAVPDQQPSFTAHALKEGSDTSMWSMAGTGDACVYRITNHNVDKEDIVHICVLVYQLDGKIKAQYPKDTGRTVVLRGGDTFEDIFKIGLPRNCLRIMTEPDLSKTEPNMGIDTLVLYATSRFVDFGPLLQSAMETEPDILKRGDADS
ncbi:hypothetical protein QZH41_016115, partial [Actinostola sp. cb2023]